MSAAAIGATDPAGLAMVPSMKRPAESVSKRKMSAETTRRANAEARRLSSATRQLLDDIAFPPDTTRAIVGRVGLPLAINLEQELGVVQAWLREASKLLVAGKGLPVSGKIHHLEQIRDHAEKLEHLTANRSDDLSAAWFDAITRVEINFETLQGGRLRATRGPHPDLKSLRRTPIAGAPPTIWPELAGFMRRAAEREIARLNVEPGKSDDHNKRQFVEALAAAFKWLFDRPATVTTDDVTGQVGSSFVSFVLSVHDSIPEIAKPYVPAITAGQVRELLRAPRGSGLSRKNARK